VEEVRHREIMEACTIGEGSSTVLHHSNTSGIRQFRFASLAFLASLLAFRPYLLFILGVVPCRFR